MTKYRLKIQTISSEWTDIQADRVLLLGQRKEEKEKSHPSNFLKFLLPTAQTAHLFLPDTQTNPSQNQKSRFLANTLITIKL
jgi:hypothetical protein